MAKQFQLGRWLVSRTHSSLHHDLLYLATRRPYCFIGPFICTRGLLSSSRCKRRSARCAILGVMLVSWLSGECYFGPQGLRTLRI